MHRRIGESWSKVSIFGSGSKMQEHQEELRHRPTSHAACTQPGHLVTVMGGNLG
jgi:hypothetical protein